MLFVVENNGIAQTTRTADTIGGSILARGAAFGLHTWHCGRRHPDLFAAGRRGRAHGSIARKPGFLVIDTMRLGPHSKGDDLRDDAEMASIRARDPLCPLGGSLASGVREAIEHRNAGFIDDVRDFRQAREEITIRSGVRARLHQPPCAVRRQESADASASSVDRSAAINAVASPDAHRASGGDRSSARIFTIRTVEPSK